MTRRSMVVGAIILFSLCLVVMVIIKQANFFSNQTRIQISNDDTKMKVSIYEKDKNLLSLVFEDGKETFKFEIHAEPEGVSVLNEPPPFVEFVRPSLSVANEVLVEEPIAMSLERPPFSTLIGFPEKGQSMEESEWEAFKLLMKEKFPNIVKKIDELSNYSTSWGELINEYGLLLYRDGDSARDVELLTEKTGFQFKIKKGYAIYLVKDGIETLVGEMYRDHMGVTLFQKNAQGEDARVWESFRQARDNQGKKPSDYYGKINL